MSEGAAKSTKKVAGKKRSRSNSKLGKQWVCALTKEPCKRAIIVKGADGSIEAFKNIPCAVRSIKDSNADEAGKAALLAQLAADYDQSVLNLPEAKHAVHLPVNGGSMTYAEWIGDLAKWDEITAQHGYTVREWDAATGKGKAASKKKREKTIFETGNYLLPVHGAPKRLAIKIEEAADAKPVEIDDVTASHRKLRSFVGEGKVYQAHSKFAGNFHASFALASGIDAFSADPVEQQKSNNARASKLIEQPVHGPAIFTFFKKTTLPQ